MTKTDKPKPFYLPDRTVRGLKIHLRYHHACSAARQWASGKTLKQAWGRCRNFDWLIWYLRKQPGCPYELLHRAIDDASKVPNRGYPSIERQQAAACKIFRQYFKVKP